jgi:hypothetical protein
MAFGGKPDLDLHQWIGGDSLTGVKVRQFAGI